MAAPKSSLHRRPQQARLRLPRVFRGDRAGLVEKIASHLRIGDAQSFMKQSFFVHTNAR